MNNVKFNVNFSNGDIITESPDKKSIGSYAYKAIKVLVSSIMKVAQNIFSTLNSAYLKMIQLIKSCYDKFIKKTEETQDEINKVADKVNDSVNKSTDELMLEGVTNDIRLINKKVKKLLLMNLNLQKSILNLVIKVIPKKHLKNAREAINECKKDYDATLAGNKNKIPPFVTGTILNGICLILVDILMVLPTILTLGV